MRRSINYSPPHVGASITSVSRKARQHTREYKPPREAFMPLKTPSSGSLRKMNLAEISATHAGTRESHSIFRANHAGNYVRSRKTEERKTHRANLEGSPVRHVHPAGILRPSFRSRRFPRWFALPESRRLSAWWTLDGAESHLPNAGSED